ncbi:MAG: CAP domain-containing protein [Patescibacteria group bacterium]|nr:CAP domain-containing protein [Patescibacteria group bacterium]
MKKLLIIALAIFMPMATEAALRDDLSGRIHIQVQKNGEAFYVYPENNERYYLGRPADAFQLMREKGLGITNLNLQQIPLASLNPIPDDSQDITDEPQNNEPESKASELANNTFNLVNSHRVSIGVPALTWVDDIAEESLLHSQNMAEGLILPSHVGFDQRVDTLADKLGSYTEAAENLAWNNMQDPAQTALESWLGSPDHKQALENPNYDITGVGVGISKESIYYFTQIFFDIK